MPRDTIYGRFGKRLCDLLLAVPLLIFLSPVLLATAICSRICLGSPVLFRQQRAGYRGRPFFIHKFRSMTDARDERGQLLPDAERLSRYGRALRSTSIDELPGLWNVVKGEMTLIGPRPLPVEYGDYYTDEQALRLEAMPGVAGYAALFGRNAQSWESIFRHDVWYVQNLSFRLDLKILLSLPGVVLGRAGIDRGGHDAASEFAERLRTGMKMKSRVLG
jgi:sugar transferase EpsL